MDVQPKTQKIITQGQVGYLKNSTKKSKEIAENQLKAIKVWQEFCEHEEHHLLALYQKIPPKSALFKKLKHLQLLARRELVNVRAQLN